MTSSLPMRCATTCAIAACIYHAKIYYHSKSKMSIIFSNIIFPQMDTIISMKNKFILCGAIGWCAEILWTGLNSFANGRFKLMGHSSLWMFPIYGCAAFIDPLSKIYRRFSIFSRGLIYMVHIFFAEFVSGSILKRFGICPWDYSTSPFNVEGVIRLDYAPLWFGLGLFYETLFKRQKKQVP